MGDNPALIKEVLPSSSFPRPSLLGVTLLMHMTNISVPFVVPTFRLSEQQYLSPSSLPPSIRPLWKQVRCCLILVSPHSPITSVTWGKIIFWFIWGRRKQNLLLCQWSLGIHARPRFPYSQSIDTLSFLWLYMQWMLDSGDFIPEDCGQESMKEEP